MRVSYKVLITWGAVFSPVLLALIFLPHMKADMLASISLSLLLLLSVVAFYIYRYESSRKNRIVFLNFALAFGLSILNFVYLFVGEAFLLSDRFAQFYYYQYLNTCFIVCASACAIVYVVFDTLFHDFKTYHKYALTLLVVGGFCAYYYYPIFSNPQYLYQTQDISDFRIIDKAVNDLNQLGVANPNVDQISNRVVLNAWKDGKPVGILFEQEKIERVAYILPYLDGLNYTLLLFKPVHHNVIYMNVLVILFIFLFFGYQYKNDPPQGAYIEKILFLFLPFCSLEILHYFAYATSSDHTSYLHFFNIAQYLIIFNLVLLFVFFSLRLHFITSVKGEFYERELVLDSEHISRWRDGIDNLVVRHFLNPKTFHGRLFTPREARSKT